MTEEVSKSLTVVKSTLDELHTLANLLEGALKRAEAVEIPKPAVKK